MMETDHFVPGTHVPYPIIYKRSSEELCLDGFFVVAKPQGPRSKNQRFSTTKITWCA